MPLKKVLAFRNGEAIPREARYLFTTSVPEAGYMAEKLVAHFYEVDCNPNGIPVDKEYNNVVNRRNEDTRVNKL